MSSLGERLRAAVRAQRGLLATVGGLALVHVTTLFPYVGGRVNHGDSAKFQFLGFISGIGHPPGNPLYLLLDTAFTRVLPAPPWLAVTLLSWACAACTLAYLYAGVRRLFGDVEAVAATVALGLGSLFWTFATEAEVYTLNTFLLAAAQYHAIGFAIGGKRRDLLLGSAFFLLGFSNHLTSVFLIPAFVAVAWAGRRSIGVWGFLAIVLFTLLGASVYGVIPLRVAQAPRYSEFPGAVTWTSFLGFVTASTYQTAVAKPTLASVFDTRLPGVLAYVEKQWPWPVLLLAPLGWARIRARVPALGTFLLLGALGPLAFALVYDIPDPDGFYMPVALLVATMLGAAVRKPTTVARWAAPLVALAFVYGAAQVHVQRLRDTPPQSLVENLDGMQGPQLWNVPELLRVVPRGATLSIPCTHYGCVEVLQYYRFADATFREKQLSLARFQNVTVGYWGDRGEPVPQLDLGVAASQCVCTLRSDDLARWRALGIETRTIRRGGRFVAGDFLQGMPVYCSAACPP